MRLKNFQKIKQSKRKRRHLRVRSKIFGRANCPRLCVSRSIKHITAQLIDDEKGQTLAYASDLEFGQKKVGKRKRVVAASPKELRGVSSKVAIAYNVGKLIAEKAKKLNIVSVVFDRGGFKYHGRVKAVAEGAREGGLKF